MQANDATQVQGTDLDDRDVRALRQYLTVLPKAPGLFAVVSESGSEYTVDAETGACTCPDSEYNLAPDERCKHAKRVDFETGRRALPAWIDRDALPEDFGAHVDRDDDPDAGAALLADGGIIDAGDEGELLEDADEERPEGCNCGPLGGLPCWPCYRAGFEEPNPDVGGEVID